MKVVQFKTCYVCELFCCVDCILNCLFWFSCSWKGGGVDLAVSVRWRGISVDTDFSPNCITALPPLMETELVLCEAGLSFVYIFYMNFSLERVNINNGL